METKITRSCLIFLQMLITGFIIFADVCGIASSEGFASSKLLIESLIRCLCVLGFSIFYYVSVKDSFSSDSLLFPLYLFFLSASETRILETVEQKLNLFLIPQQYLVFTLIMSTLMLAFSLIGYALLVNNSKTEINLFTGASVAVSFALSVFFPKAQTILSIWNSKILIFLVTFFFAVGIIISLMQAVLESLSSSRIKYIICVLLLVNNYVNLVYNTPSMTLVGTALFFVSTVLTVVLVEINSARL